MRKSIDLLSWAMRLRNGKSSLPASILEPKTRPKSIKTEVRKRIEKRTPPGNDFFRFSTDFGGPGRPPGAPKWPEIRLLGPPEPAPGLTGTRFGRFWAKTLSCDSLGDAIWTVLGTLRDRFWTISGPFRVRFWTVSGRFWEVPVHCLARSWDRCSLRHAALRNAQVNRF